MTVDVKKFRTATPFQKIVLRATRGLVSCVVNHVAMPESNEDLQ